MVSRDPLKQHLSQEDFETVQTGGDIYSLNTGTAFGSNQTLELIGDEWLPESESLTVDDVVICTCCMKPVLFLDSRSPGDEALCSECDTEITGRKHAMTLPVHPRVLRRYSKLRIKVDEYIGRPVTEDLKKELYQAIYTIIANDE